jgi:hypothetical protein
MSASIVKRLRSWIQDNADDLRKRGILVEERLPDEQSSAPWKASVGFIFQNIVASYTVWERTRYQTELIVVNSKLNQTLITRDSEPQSLEDVDSDLNDLLQRLYRGDYQRMPAP